MKIKRIILSLLLAVPLISAFNIEQPSSNNFPLPIQMGIRGSIEIESVTLDRVPTTKNTTATGVFNFIVRQPCKLIYYFLYCNAHISCLSFNCPAGTIDLDPSQIYEPRTSYSVGIILKMESDCTKQMRPLIPDKYQLVFFLVPDKQSGGSASQATALIAINS